MKLIGGKDYYDGGLRFGRDETVIYVRHKEKKLPEDELPNNPLGISHSHSGSVLTMTNIKTLQVYFCGRLYTGAIISGYDQNSKPFRNTVWNLEEFNACCAAKEVRISNFENKRAKEYFADNGSEKHMDLLVEKGITIAVLEQINWGDNFWYIDGFNLKNYEFYRVKDSFTAYQEIFAWVSGVLPEQGRKAPDITDDKIKIAKHGFDVKTSFRKEKSKS